MKRVLGSGFAACALLPVGLLLAACRQDSAEAPAPKPPEVGIVVVEAKPFAVVRELPGRITPTRVAEVRPRVSGIVTQRLFEQGSDVKAGEPLYQIDPKPFEVELQSAEAALERARAGYDLAVSQSGRSEALLKSKALSTAQHEIAVATVAQAKAEVSAREADLARARLNLDYATIRAPISGRIGAALASEGALVVQNDATSLAVIQQLDPIYADFTQSVADLTRLRRSLEAGDLERIAPEAVQVHLELEDGSAYRHPGKLLFSDARVDMASGQVTLRGLFPNAERELLPGMYVRVLIEQGIDSDALAVPEQAIQRNGGGGSEVFVVKDDNRVAVQPVRLGTAHGGRWQVLEGLKPGDRVVVDGFQKIAAGDAVQPRAFAPEAGAAGAKAHPTAPAMGGR
ncbi:MAG: efflux RND transporter periplasmic adaptor subunit [Reyranellaceae bacterium]